MHQRKFPSPPRLIPAHTLTASTGPLRRHRRQRNQILDRRAPHPRHRSGGRSRRRARPLHPVLLLALVPPPPRALQVHRRQRPHAHRLQRTQGRPAAGVPPSAAAGLRATAHGAGVRGTAAAVAGQRGRADAAAAAESEQHAVCVVLPFSCLLHFGWVWGNGVAYTGVMFFSICC